MSGCGQERSSRRAVKTALLTGSRPLGNGHRGADVPPLFEPNLLEPRTTHV
jgi:hypothetical protein